MYVKENVSIAHFGVTVVGYVTLCAGERYGESDASLVTGYRIDATLHGDSAGVNENTAATVKTTVSPIPGADTAFMALIRKQALKGFSYEVFRQLEKAVAETISERTDDTPQAGDVDEDKDGPF